ncbi:alpha-L-fucosidase [Amycolatopsis sp. cg5]|uniref:alpha-L-fucosidase n=1 Tax=Amycolatopsis sp. cg5 TaxID=3238802 RepID=UPI00352477EC
MTARQASSAAVERFQDDRFGMFVHWGLYSLIGTNEWVMFHDRYSRHEYAQLAQRFDAPDFDADAWVQLAAEAGQRYLTITSRHHDGFSMYDTSLSEHKVTKTPFGRDPIAELAEAGARHGVRLGFFVSLVDWHHPAYRAHVREVSGLAWSDYLGFLSGQVRELCTQYGDIAQFWLDGYWPQEPHTTAFPNWFAPGGDFDFGELYELIHTLQPDAVVVNNHHAVPFPGEDVQEYEGDIAGENTHPHGINVTAPVLTAGETCQTVTSTSYGFARDVHEYRPASELASLLARAAGAGSNLLLNVGPTPEGTIPAPAADRLTRLGAWLGRAGEGIYATRAGVLRVADKFGDNSLAGHVASTRGKNDDGVHYIHLLDGSVPTSFVVDFPAGVNASSVEATLLHDGGEVRAEIRADGDSLHVTVPAERRDGLITTVRLAVQ